MAGVHLAPLATAEMLELHGQESMVLLYPVCQVCALVAPQVEACQNYPPISPHAQQAVWSQVQAIIASLPPDLQPALRVQDFVPFPAAF